MTMQHTLSERELQELCILQELASGYKSSIEIAQALWDNKWSISLDEIRQRINELSQYGLVQITVMNLVSITDAGKQRLDDLIQTRDEKGEFRDLVEKTTKFLDEHYPEFGRKHATEELQSINVQLSEDALDAWWNMLSPAQKGEVVSSQWESELASKMQLSFCKRAAR